MKKTLRFVLLAAVVSILCLRCKNPLNDIEVNVNADVIKYSAVIDLKEITGAVPTGLQVSVTGEDKDAVYDLGGFKTISVNNGIVAVGLDPRTTPSASNPIKFNLVISGGGYLPMNIPVTMVGNQLQQIRSVKVMKVTAPAPGCSTISPAFGLTNGATASAVTFGSALSSANPETVTVGVPAGTSFKDADGKAISGSNLQVNMAEFDNSEESMSVFPGGSMTATDVLGPNNSTSALTFIPAGFLNLDMSVNNIAVRLFSQPISLSMGIDTDYKNPGTDAAVKAGDMLAVYSYQVESGQWKFESNVPVISSNGKLKVDFTTNHLTWYMVGKAVEACTSGLTLNIKAPWTAGKEHPVRVEVKMKGFDSYKVFKAEFSLTDNKIEFIDKLPNKPLSVVVYNGLDGQVLAETEISSSCNQSVTLNVKEPATLNPEVSMKLTVKCPNKLAVVPPDFFFYYKETGKNEPFKLLGLVSKGEFKTRILKTGVHYDFMAVWGSRTKTVYDKTVSLTNVLEVNDKNYGRSKGNLEILVQECK